MRKDASEKKGGRKKASIADPEMIGQLKQNLEAHTAGSPVEPEPTMDESVCGEFGR